jgi:signal transduction histidine kinase
MPGEGTLSVGGRLDGDGVLLEFADTGVGMEPEALARIFEPYFSTRTSGTGLGLTIAKRNIETSRGRITAESTRGQGTTVRLWLPAAEA